MRVKICGNRSGDEIRLAAQAGADAVGLIVGIRHRTEDSLDIDTAAGLLAATPVFVSTVLVTHRIYADEILDIHRHVPTSTIQLHDDIGDDQIKLLKERLPKVPLIKAVHVVDEGAIDDAGIFSPLVDALLLDSRTADRIGGTGIVHDWSISARIVSAAEKPVILAGGLTPDNVVEAIRCVKPYAVDVNSGVEFPDGSKAPDKVRKFVATAKSETAAAYDTELRQPA